MGLSIAEPIRDEPASILFIIYLLILSILSLIFLASRSSRDVHLFTLLGHGAALNGISRLLQHFTQVGIAQWFLLILTVNEFFECLLYFLYIYLFAIIGDKRQ